MSTKGSPSRAAVSVIALLGCLLLISCRVSPTGTLIGPTVGPQPWWRVKSAHFTLLSDVGTTEAKEIVIDLERTYRILSELGFPTDKPPNFHTDVIIFREAEEYKRIGPKSSGGFFAGSTGLDVLNQPMFVTFGGLSKLARRTLIHEMTHRFVHYVCPQAPTWLNEGLADYYSTIEVDGGQAFLGRSRDYFFKPGKEWDYGRGGIPMDVVPTLGELWSLTGESFYPAREAPEEGEGEGEGDEGKAMRRAQTANYAGAWVTTHVLKNGPRHYNGMLFQWLAKMAAGAPGPVAFEQVFSPEVQGAIERDRQSLMTEFAASGQLPVTRFEYDVKQAVQIEDRALGEAEVDLLQARFAFRRKDTDEARRRLNAALAKDPALTEARLWSARLHASKDDYASQERELLEAATRAPNDERVAYSLYLFYKQSREGSKDAKARREMGDAILTKWLPIAKSPTVLNGFAWDMALAGRAKEAVSVAKKSTELNPSCAECFDTLAVALFRVGELKAAVSAQEISVALLGERGTDGELVMRLKLFQKAWAAFLIWKKRPTPGQDPSVLPESVVEAILNAEKLLFLDCYIPARPDRSKPSGAVVIRGDIGPDGVVKSIEVVPPEQWETVKYKSKLPPIADEAAARCTAERIGTARFPESSQPTPFVTGVAFNLLRNRSRQ